MSPESAEDILTRYAAGTCTPQEQALVRAWYLGWREAHPEALTPAQLEALAARTEAQLTARLFGEAAGATPAARPRLRGAGRRARVLAALAGLALGLGGGGYWLLHQPAGVPAAAPVATAPIRPGRNQATLTLADGARIVLTEARAGQLARQGGATVAKLATGQLAYHAAALAVPTAVAYNTLATPRGGQYQLTLADGTRVWLNAASSLRYPVAFGGQERRVQLTGEAYFEVAKDRAHPFRVEAGAQTVEVLGTHFDVEAYPDEAGIRTTLLEGAVRVAHPGGSQALVPGEQAYFGTGGVVVRRVNTEAVVAWKNGYFRFQNEDIQHVMRKLARWYDVDARYLGPVPQVGFYGKISRYQNIADVLRLLEKTQEVHFTVAGRQVTVRP